MKKFLVFLCAMSLVFGIVGLAGATLYNGHDYVVVSYPSQSWDSATSHMAALGPNYHLATITDALEQTFIEGLLAGSGEYWLGGYQKDWYQGQAPEDDWNWVTGEPWVYTNWYPGEPNDSGMEQYLATWGNFGWMWNDEGRLGNISGYVAESVPEPATMLLLGSGLIGLAGLGRKKFLKK